MNLNFLRMVNENFSIKVFTAFTVFIFVISSSFTAFFIHNQSKFLTDTLIKNGKLLAGVLAHNSRIAVFSEDEELLIDSIGGVLQQEEVVEVSVFTEQGKLWKTLERSGIKTLEKSAKGEEMNRNKILEQLKDSMSSFYLEKGDKLEFWSPVTSGSGYSTEESLFFEQDPLQRTGRVIGFVRIMVDKKMLNTRLRDLMFKGIFMGMIFLILGAGFTYLMVKGVTKPLNRLTKSVKALGVGGVVEQVPVETEDEVGRLAKAFNDMSESLRKRETEKQQLEEQLRQAQKMEAIGTLAGGIAHDFNNLLMAIQGNVSLGLYNIDSTHPHYEFLKNIENQVQSGARLTRQLLGYARKGKYEIRTLNLNEILEETSDSLGMTRKDITVHRDLAEGLFAVEADQGQIEQLLWNLYVNAADAMPGGGDLFLKTMNVRHEDMRGKVYDPKPGNYVFLMIADTGAGMNEEIMERIFEPFFTTKEMGKGTGLGLASVYGIVKGHGGYVDVDSEKGHGTTFSIYLPATYKIAPKKVTTPDRFIKGEETILLVDDEAGILNIGDRFLKKFGYTVLEAKSGIEAVEIYKAHKDSIDLVILDMIMPNMGGGKTYDILKEINPHVKVLLSSGYSIDGQATEILNRGCNGFIQKPFDMGGLSVKIREILDQE
jgi:signal transduction histidine kinase/CheY-like chemotaxis protein